MLLGERPRILLALEADLLLEEERLILLALEPLLLLEEERLTLLALEALRLLLAELALLRMTLDFDLLAEAFLILDIFSPEI